MNLRTFRAALTLTLGGLASAQIACSSSDPSPAAASGGTPSSAGGSTAAPSGGGGNAAVPTAGTAGTVVSGGTGGALPTAGTGGAPDGTGGVSTGGSGGSVGNGGSGVSGGGGSGGSGGAPQSGGVTLGAGRVVVTGVRDTAQPTAQSTVQLHNGGQTAVQVMGLALSGTDQALFKIANAPTFPAALAPGADMAVTVSMTTIGAGLPAKPTDAAARINMGAAPLSATLTATLSAGSAVASVYGLLLDQANYEPTLGQILNTLGYKLNVGMALNNWNSNTSMNASTLPGVEAGTDEVAASHFVKAGSGNVGMLVVARFSPVGALPYGWYDTTTGCPTGCTTVGTMAMVTDPQTSDKARMVYPPLAAGSMTSFDPGAAPFGLWVYSDQKTQKFNEGGTMANGDWDYSEDKSNSPSSHRFKSYPLKDANGTAIPQSYLVAVEEAGNGDYQDYVFVLSNVTAMP